jgi:para-aminobenzoate synthetase component 1
MQEKAFERNFYFRKHPVEFSRYTEAFDRVTEAINRGDTFLLNLTFPTQLDTNLTLDHIFQSGHARYRLKFKDQFVVFSPETFVTIQGNTITTYPMKGTIDAFVDNAEDKLMNDIKEVSEHNTIVDLLRNDLNMISKKVRVEKFRYVERVKTHERELLQTSSKISGELAADWKERVGDILLKLLPAGSISGAPKKKTREIINAVEGYDRGWFTGVFGLFDGKILESAVMIRYIEQIDGNLVFKSGGGITYFSNCEQEYNELIEKVGLPTL